MTFALKMLLKFKILLNKRITRKIALNAFRYLKSLNTVSKFRGNRIINTVNTLHAV